MGERLSRQNSTFNRKETTETTQPPQKHNTQNKPSDQNSSKSKNSASIHTPYLKIKIQTADIAMASSPVNAKIPQMKYGQLMEIVRMHTFAPQYRETLRQTLEHYTTLFETLTNQLVELVLGHCNLQIQTESPEIAVREFLNRAFEYNQLWDKIGQEVWVNLLTWTVQDLEPPIARTVIANIAQEPYREDLWQLLMSPEANPTLLNRLEILICQDLNAQILQNPQILESLLVGLSLEQNISEIPTFSLTIHPCCALEDLSAIADSHPQIDSLASQVELPPTAPIILEHYLTRPSELYRLPWELMAQVKRQCGLPLVQLLCLLVGHSMRQPHPTLSTFTLTYREIQAQLDWAVHPQTAPPPNLTHLLQDLSSLTIATIWMAEPSTTYVEASHTSGHPWDLLSETQGDFDWTSGGITQPTEQSITLRPGLWLHHLLQQGGSNALSAWESFGKVALKLLERDRARDSFFISLLISLSIQAPQALPKAKPSFYTVQNLLDMTLPASTLETLQIHPDMALALFKTWNQSLEALLSLGWSGKPTTETSAATPTDFYLAPYPDWLHINNHSRKPSDWIVQWLAQPLQFISPADLMGHFSTALDADGRLSSNISQKPSRRLRFERLSGADIRRARKAKQLTQSQLADVLHVHQSLIAKIEVGQRSITEELEQSLRQALEL
jgi:DNA-binding XRE family transcriptional regulator